MLMGIIVFDGLMQDCGISSAYALEIPQSCTKLLYWYYFIVMLCVICC